MVLEVLIWFLVSSCSDLLSRAKSKNDDFPIGPLEADKTSKVMEGFLKPFRFSLVTSGRLSVELQLETRSR